ncbi:Hypothetical predicted protein [Olea europaea subsp. europaea]|uniref:Uncharacterized protein n=1 Tax=Olea europaea subsp. europaea TaxID=158383 RepID=A0A8S0QRS2_OLEEU|nr:Hypothetical predicted protein [Olea europaea subsp. europaea]
MSIKEFNLPSAGPSLESVVSALIDSMSLKSACASQFELTSRSCCESFVGVNAYFVESRVAPNSFPCVENFTVVVVAELPVLWILLHKRYEHVIRTQYKFKNVAKYTSHRQQTSYGSTQNDWQHCRTRMIETLQLSTILTGSKPVMEAQKPCKRFRYSQMQVASCVLVVTIIRHFYHIVFTQGDGPNDYSQTSMEYGYRAMHMDTRM